ncbi:FIG00914433: hypothetical protein [hydrothermal vent metagenome]|uniref:Uncharacterized protein n=1 Tax=hydrothermal vent metagenome TaxID=652676 RepID=A0A1W1BVR4_9ZZZZ
MKQIKERGYHQQYLSDYNEIYILGIEFDSQKRNITTYEWERIL